MKIIEKILILLTASMCTYSFAAEPVTIHSKTVGGITITSSDSDGWKIDAEAVSEGDLREIVTIHISRNETAVPPRMTFQFELPLTDMYHVWHCFPSNDRFPIKPEWGNRTESQISKDIPLMACFNDDNTNRLTIACDEAFRRIKFSYGAKEEGCLFSFRMSLFQDLEAPMREYTCRLLLDKRPVFWSKSIEEASAWIMESASLKPLPVPQAAYEPLYSSWYQFHQDVSAQTIEQECRLAAGMGMKTFILDDGWQTDDNNRGYAFCGDWEVCKNKFPDMKAHVDAVHGMGMKYMVWYSVPYIGKNSRAWQRFKGMYLYESGEKAILDPRFPQVREYLAGIYLAAMKEWGLDGFKLDFIDKFIFQGKDPAIAEDYAGRDIKSLPGAVDTLMKEITARLREVNPDVLIEFRQHYIGPAIRQYGNMFRCSDCPADYFSNRIRTANLRLTSGVTAVHSDMLEWNSEESTEVAARHILSSIFSTIQYSLMLRDLKPESRKMMAHWISFTRKHRETLLHGEFLPYDPQMCYPVIEARTPQEQIVALYQNGKSVNVGTDAPVSYLINASCNKNVIAFFERQPLKIRFFNTFGEEVTTKPRCREIPAGKPVVLEIPVSGYAEMSF